jgi:PPK2 family polyphosphate:nucleotide phosphotransferase
VNYRKRFRIEPDASVDLSERDPGYADTDLSKSDTAARIERNRLRIADAHMRLYAEGKQSLLIVLQGMDTAGKDGVVSHIFSAVNPLGCIVTSFKQPSAEELAHDFLWRVERATPRDGAIGIFNRSHYESVLVERVHDLVDRKVIRQRYRQINDFERRLAETGVTIVKFFLHISEDEQLARFKDRLDDKDKQWKISPADYSERAFWKDYRKAYEIALTECSTKFAPWYVIPANHKWFRDLAISEILVDTFADMEIAEPKPSVDLDQIRALYAKAASEAKH